jgi:hypothetical protein
VTVSWYQLEEFSLEMQMQTFPFEVSNEASFGLAKMK